jgi:hypothetical protein
MLKRSWKKDRSVWNISSVIWELIGPASAVTRLLVNYVFAYAIVSTAGRVGEYTSSRIKRRV